MLEDKFKLTRANITLIVINCVLVIFVIAAAIQLIGSLKDSSGEIPELKTTLGKSSTLVADGTSTTTTESTTTTTKKKGNESSPYYDIDVYSILNKELVEKQNLTKDEAIELGKEFFKIYEGIFIPSDDDFVNINYLLSKVKDGESDKITVDGKSYGIIYNGRELFQSLFTNDNLHDLPYTTINGVDPLYYDNQTHNYYKLGGDLKKNYEIVSYEYQKISTTIRIKLIYKDVDSKSSAYKSGYVSLKYIEDEKKWKSDGISFPNEE